MMYMLPLLVALGCSGKSATPEPAVSAPANVSFEVKSASIGDHHMEGEPGVGHIEVLIENTGDVLMDYPSLVLASTDGRIVLVEPSKKLYGLPAGPSPMSWSFDVSDPIPAGAELHFDLKLFAHGLPDVDAPGDAMQQFDVKTAHDLPPAIAEAPEE